MTVAEVIEQLFEYPLDCNVYVPDKDGTTQIVKQVAGLKHLELPEGISIPDDVCLTPWEGDGESL